jgi:hypothetical protein
VIVRPIVGEWEVPCIEAIHVHETRRVAQIAIPGLLGDLQQDLGTTSLVVEIRGSLVGDAARDELLGEIREQYRAGEPVSFTADITTATELERVLIIGLDVIETNVAADSLQYRILLREYVEPPEPPTAIDDLGAGLDADLDLLAGLGLEGLELPDLLGEIPSIGNLVEPLRPALAGVDSATAGLGGLLGDLKSKLGIA